MYFLKKMTIITAINNSFTCFVKEKDLSVFFDKQKSIRSALYAQSKTIRESTNTQTQR